MEIQDGRDNPIFIHSELDDYGLTLVEFRVYARLARRCGRATAYESVPNMARDFGVKDRTVQRALKLLISARLIAAKPRPGFSTVYTLLPLSAWLPANALGALREHLAKPAKKGEVVTSEPGVGGDIRAGGVVTSGPGVVVTSGPEEGSPSEGSPPKVLPHTHLRAVGAPAESANAGVGVGSSKSRFSFEERKAHARANSLGSGWLNNSRDGRYDEMIADALARSTPEAIEQSITTPAPKFKPYRAAFVQVMSVVSRGGVGSEPGPEIERLFESGQIDEETRRLLLARDWSAQAGGKAA
jgi:hypothetical protein